MPAPSPPVTVTVTGAAGQIGYALLFRIASGQLLGPDTPVRLRLLEIPQAVQAAEGIALELRGLRVPAAAPASTSPTTPTAAFDGVNVALLVGARPRTKGMERGDLLEANGGIFAPQGRAINAGAADDVRVLVVGNPANTNALIAQAAAPDVPAERFTAMTRLDHNRARRPARRRSSACRSPTSSKLTIWGNHSATQYPDLFHAEVGGKIAAEQVDEAWLRDEFIPRVAKRGAEIIEVRGRVVGGVGGERGHRPRLRLGQRHRRTATGPPPRSRPTAPTASPRASSPASPSPRRTARWEIVQGLEIDEFSRARIDAIGRRAPRGARRGQGAGPDLAGLHEHFRQRWRGRGVPDGSCPELRRSDDRERLAGDA